MASKSMFRKKSGSTSGEDAGDKDRLIAGLKGRIAVLEKKNNDLAALNGKLRGLAQAVEQSASVVVVTDTAGSIQYVNPKFTELTGYSFEEAIDKNPSILKTGETPPEEYERLWETIRSGKEWHGVFHNRKKNGDLYWESAIISPVMDDHGKVTNFMAVKEDITERKQMVDALRASEEKFHILADSTYDWVVWCDPAGNNVYVSPSCERITGHGAGEFYRDPGLLKRIVHPDDVRAFEQHMDAYLRNASLCASFDFRIISAIGEIRWIDHVCRPVFRDNGEWLGRRASNRDITERKRAEEALRESEGNLARAQAISHIGNWHIDPVTERASGSDELFRIFGVPRREAFSFSELLERVHPDDRPMVRAYIKEVKRTRQKKSFDFRIVRPDGEERDIFLDGEFALDGEGGFRMSGTMQDITERKRVEKELEDHRKRLEDLVQERTRKLDEEKRQADLYVDLMGHDISNINQAGMGNLELLQAVGNLDALGRERASAALRAFEKSSELIKNVKKLQKVKKGGLRLEKINVSRILDGIKDAYKKVPGRDVAIRLTSPGGCFVHADGLLYDVFSNIVDNSVKHSSGPVNININLSAVETDDKKYYRISIEDDGAGIIPDLKKRIFDRMYYEGGIMRGKGLGLYLVNTLVEYFHGTISVEDRISGDHTKGARFVVELPAA